MDAPGYKIRVGALGGGSSGTFVLFLPVEQPRSKPKYPTPIGEDWGFSQLLDPVEQAAEAFSTIKNCH